MTEFLPTEDGQRIAYKRHIGRASAPCFIWCGGLKSDMEGSKAAYLHGWAQKRDVNYIRFDYFGHGESSGEFTDGTVSRWAGDVLRVIGALTAGPVVLFGSSMGGWASLLAAQESPQVKALILINPAPDFTQKMVWAGWDDARREMLETDGVVYEPSDYGEPYAYSKALIEDGRARQILDSPIEFTGAVRILQGEQDSVVPWEYSQKILPALQSRDVHYTLVKGGDHSLSREEDLELLGRTASALLSDIANAGS